MKKIGKWYTIIGLAMSYFIYSSLININYYFSIFFLFAYIFLFLAKYNGKIKNFEWKKYRVIIIPELLLIVYNLFLIAFDFVGKTNISTIFFKKDLARILLFITTSLGSIALYDIYKEKTIKMFYCAVILNYLVYIVLAIATEGVGGIIYYIASNFTGKTAKSVLEAHEITFSISILLLYFLFEKKFKQLKFPVAILLIIFLLGFKRIAIIGMFISIIMFKGLERVNSKKLLKTLFIVGGIIFVIMSMVWLNLVKEDQFNTISRNYHINFMGRTHLYSLVKDEFCIKPSFKGKGLGYIAYWGEMNSRKTNGYALHSGIIEMYVDIGFIGYIVYTMNKLVLNSFIILKEDKNKAKQYFCITFYILILWTTDNVATYLNFLLLANIIFINCLFSKKLLIKETS